MWITAWLLVAGASQNQPYLPPFATQADCEQVRQAYISNNRSEKAAVCVQAKVYVNVPK